MIPWSTLIATAVIGLALMLVLPIIAGARPSFSQSAQLRWHLLIENGRMAGIVGAAAPRQAPMPGAHMLPGHQQPAPPPTAPFVRGALERCASAAGYTQTVTLGTSQQPLPTLEIPSFGFFRRLYLQLTVDQITDGTFKADGIDGVFAQVGMKDVNGNDIMVPLRGKTLALVNKYCTIGSGDPSILFPNTLSRIYEVPAEICNRDALGSLPNMDSSSKYLVNMTIDTLANIFTVNPTAAPNVTVTAWVSRGSRRSSVTSPAWASSRNPPAVNTVQYISSNLFNFPAAGNQQIQLLRRGNMIRQLILIARNSSGVRSDSVLPTSLDFRWDNREVYNVATEIQRHRQRKVFNMAAEAGVLVFDNTHDLDGRAGGELRDNWFRTLMSSSLDLIMQGIASAGQLEVVTIDVAPAAGSDIYIGGSSPGATTLQAG